MRTAVVAGVLGLLVAGFAAHAVPKFESSSTSGVDHEDGEARWSDRLVRAPSNVCDRPGVPRPLFPFPTPEQLKNSSPDCVANAVWIRNASARPIQCQVSIDVPDAAKPAGARLDSIVYPGTEMAGGQEIGRIDQVPRAFASNCRILPPQPLAELKIADGCEAKVRAPNPDDFYPPASIRRGEEGAVTFEYSVDAQTRAPKDVAIVSASGFVDFDTAALKFARQVRVETACTDQRYRLTVHFKIADK